MKQTIGVYKIVNKVNGNFYIGSSKDVEGRFTQHIRGLSKGDHHCSPLQSAFNKYGLDNLELIIVVETAEDERFKVEQTFLDKDYGRKHCYNVSASAYGVDGRNISKRNIEYFSNPENRIKQGIAVKKAWADLDNPMRKKLEIAMANPEYKSRLSTSSKNMWKNQEIRASISSKSKANAKKQWASKREEMIESLNSEECKAKKSQALKDKWQDLEYKAKMLSRPALTDLAKVKISKAVKLRFSNPENIEKQKIASVNRKPIKCNETGAIYSSISMAAKDLKVAVKSIKKATLPGRTCKTYTFSYVEDIKEII